MNNKYIFLKLGVVLGIALIIAGMYLYVTKELTYTPRRRMIAPVLPVAAIVSDDTHHQYTIAEVIRSDDKLSTFKPHYIIIHTSLEDLSFNGIPRFTRRISVPLGLSSEDLKQNLSHAAWRLQKEKNAAAVIILAHRDDDKNRIGGFTAGKCTLAPFGDWSKATINFNTDSLRPTFEFAEVYNKNIPIYKIMGDTTLRSNTDLYQDIETIPDSTITNLKKGTRIIILDHYRMFTPYDFIDWYKVQTNYSKRKNYAGWVQGKDIIEPTKVIDSKYLHKVAISQSKTSNRVQTNTKKHSVQNKKWYEGGTLYKVTLSEWRRATYENKLATCAGFIINGTAIGLFKFNAHNFDWDFVKSRSEELVLCIDSYANGSNRSYKVEKQTVTEVVALAVTLLGWVR